MNDEDLRKQIESLIRDEIQETIKSFEMRVAASKEEDAFCFMTNLFRV